MIMEMDPLNLQTVRFHLEKFFYFYGFWDAPNLPQSDYTFEDEYSSSHDIEFSDSNEFEDESDSFSEERPQFDCPQYCFIRFPHPNFIWDSDSEPSFSDYFWTPHERTTDDEKQAEED